MGSKGCPFSLSKAIKAWMLLDEMVRNGPKWSEMVRNGPKIMGTLQNHPISWKIEGKPCRKTTFGLGGIAFHSLSPVTSTTEEEKPFGSPVIWSTQ